MSLTADCPSQKAIPEGSKTPKFMQGDKEFHAKGWDARRAYAKALNAAHNSAPADKKMNWGLLFSAEKELFKLLKQEKQMKRENAE